MVLFSYLTNSSFPLLVVSSPAADMSARMITLGIDVSCYLLPLSYGSPAAFGPTARPLNKIKATTVSRYGIASYISLGNCPKIGIPKATPKESA